MRLLCFLGFPKEIISEPELKEPCETLFELRIYDNEMGVLPLKGVKETMDLP